jgi:hypothetical protein
MQQPEHSGQSAHLLHSILMRVSRTGASYNLLSRTVPQHSRISAAVEIDLTQESYEAVIQPICNYKVLRAICLISFSNLYSPRFDIFISIN